ncbi:hypothetical protein [Peribacillus loiseleuriae]|uniref:hypothetical protein n=1 Tax=Peribacillus loiseleuriae TaxID=1679170 RepID=UPI0006717E4D|nr:hypothetical protein [Peribacillus loiseleuriae]
MKKEVIMKLIPNMSYLKPKPTQKDAIRQLIYVPEEYVDLLIQRDMKTTWPNAMLIISSIGFPKNENSIPSLLFLMQDINWPGAIEAVEIVKNIGKRSVLPYLEDALEIAYKSEDYMWIGGLKYLVDSLNIIESDFCNLQNYETLQLADF